jgi:hypothetical protein
VDEKFVLAAVTANAAGKFNPFPGVVITAIDKIFDALCRA